jgi:hypothetical protein
MPSIYPFEVSPAEIARSPEPYVDAVFETLESAFLTMPRGTAFVEYGVFERAYESLKKATNGFRTFTVDGLVEAFSQMPVSFVVLRSILGFSPPEWAYVATERTGKELSQNAVRSLDKMAREAGEQPLSLTPTRRQRLAILAEAACLLLAEGLPEVPEGYIHRLDKADTGNGLAGVRNLAQMGVPYAMLLYERFLGRPFAGHRDAVSELVGDGLESAIERVLVEAGVSFRKTGRAEKLAGFDQAPDFVIPSEFSPAVVMEAKITEDDGTARDKVTRIQHLAELARMRQNRGEPGFEVVACIGGRGFKVRREDMRKMLLATEGKVFTLRTLDRLVECTRLREFCS